MTTVQLTALAFTVSDGASYEDKTLAAHLRDLKKIKGVSWANPPGTVWFFAFVGGRVIGAVAYVEKDGQARFKSDAVLDEFRGKGVYAALCKKRMEWAEDRCVSRATCFSSADSRRQFLKDGFKELRDNNGIAYMERRF